MDSTRVQPLSRPHPLCCVSTCSLVLLCVYFGCPLSASDGAGSASGGGLLASPLPSALSSDPSAPASSKVSDSSARIDGFLHSIGSMYYRNQVSLTKDSSGAPAAEVWVSADYDKLEYPTLDLLLSPLRKVHVLDNWAPREIALFEAGICAVGKDFHAIANLVRQHRHTGGSWPRGSGGWLLPIRISSRSAAHTSALSLPLLPATHCCCLLLQITSKTCKECVDFYYVWKKSSHYALWKNLGKPSKKPHANKEEQWKAIKGQMEGSAGAAAGATTGGAAVKKES